MLLYAMICGTVPFLASSLTELHSVIKAGHFSFPCNISAGIFYKNLTNRRKELNPWITQN